VVFDLRLEEFKRIVFDEVVQRREEGYDTRDVEEKLSRIREPSISDLNNVLRDLENCPLKADFPYVEPSDLDSIITERPEAPKRFELALSDDEILDKIYGGWLGRCAGCMLGKPVEGFNRSQVELWLRITNAYPLDDYFPPIRDMPDDAPKWLRDRVSQVEYAFKRTGVGVLRGQISRVARDDDIDYTILNLYVLENYGLEFTTVNIGETWLTLLPYWQVYTAERVAYRNLVKGLTPPETATYMNPYREWIGAQIRADVWGYVAPGKPELAAELAYRDARLSHVKNGIYGEMFVSAMISAAFATDDVGEIVQAGLSVIPRNSRLAEAVKDVLNWSVKFNDWRDTLSRIYEKYGSYHPVHTVNNAAVVLMGLLYGGGDYGKSIAISVMGGLDTDCNGATVGSILGVILGAEALPEKWVKPLNDLVESYVVGYNGSRVSELAERTFRMAKKTVEV